MKDLGKSGKQGASSEWALLARIKHVTCDFLYLLRDIILYVYPASIFSLVRILASETVQFM